MWSYLRRSRRFANRGRDLFDQHYITPHSQGESNWHKNIELLHLHCHDGKKHSSNHLKGTNDSGSFNEEPGEGKLSRPVLLA
ncbi:MAG: hypothetical protein F6J99_12725 [Moorea sp. SIO4G3]|nr:hypothetical protein [Moorena sp. SIO4G3]